MPVYDRDDWHVKWLDYDGDCQDAREEVLIRDALSIELSSSGCVIKGGRWLGPYSLVYLEKEDIDIDHVVPLEHAHIMGAWRWSKEKREQFANDPDNLLAVSYSENRSKGSKSLGEWMPKHRDAWCDYIDKWVFVKKKYDIPISISEKIVIDVNERTCDANE